MPTPDNKAEGPESEEGDTLAGHCELVSTKYLNGLLAENQRLRQVAHDFLTATEGHSADNGVEYARSEAQKALGLIVECAACSEAGGADRAIYHQPPVCGAALNPE